MKTRTKHTGEVILSQFQFDHIINSHDVLVEACKEALNYAKMHDCMSMVPLERALKQAGE